jgi:hypothetical protein
MRRLPLPPLIVYLLALLSQPLLSLSEAKESLQELSQSNSTPG